MLDIWIEKTYANFNWNQGKCQIYKTKIICLIILNIVFIINHYKKDLIIYNNNLTVWDNLFKKSNHYRLAIYWYKNPLRSWFISDASYRIICM